MGIESGSGSDCLNIHRNRVSVRGLNPVTYPLCWPLAPVLDPVVCVSAVTPADSVCCDIPVVVWEEKYRRKSRRETKRDVKEEGKKKTKEKKRKKESMKETREE